VHQSACDQWATIEHRQKVSSSLFLQAVSRHLQIENGARKPTGKLRLPFPSGVENDMCSSDRAAPGEHVDAHDLALGQPALPAVLRRRVPPPRRSIRILSLQKRGQMLVQEVGFVTIWRHQYKATLGGVKSIKKCKARDFLSFPETPYRR
jgi:hypothetical protein